MKVLGIKSDAQRAQEKRERQMAAAATADDSVNDDEADDLDLDAAAYERAVLSGELPPIGSNGKTPTAVLGDIPSTSTTDHVHVPGLDICEDVLSIDEERTLMKAIDDAHWMKPHHAHGMARRVQHYGYAFNYETKTVDPNKFIGSLPTWITPLIPRLKERKVVTSEPDQLTINEYTPGQGIRYER